MLIDEYSSSIEEKPTSGNSEEENPFDFHDFADSVPITCEKESPISKAIIRNAPSLTDSQRLDYSPISFDRTSYDSSNGYEKNSNKSKPASSGLSMVLAQEKHITFSEDFIRCSGSISQETKQTVPSFCEDGVISNLNTTDYIENPNAYLTAEQLAGSFYGSYGDDDDDTYIENAAPQYNRQDSQIETTNNTKTSETEILFKQPSGLPVHKLVHFNSNNSDLVLEDSEIFDDDDNQDEQKPHELLSHYYKPVDNHHNYEADTIPMKSIYNTVDYVENPEGFVTAEQRAAAGSFYGSYDSEDDNNYMEQIGKQQILESNEEGSNSSKTITKIPSFSNVYGITVTPDESNQTNNDIKKSPGSFYSCIDLINGIIPFLIDVDAVMDLSRNEDNFNASMFYLYAAEDGECFGQTSEDRKGEAPPISDDTDILNMGITDFILVHRRTASQVAQICISGYLIGKLPYDGYTTYRDPPVIFKAATDSYDSDDDNEHDSPHDEEQLSTKQKYQLGIDVKNYHASSTDFIQSGSGSKQSALRCKTDDCDLDVIQIFRSDTDDRLNNSVQSFHQQQLKFGIPVDQHGNVSIDYHDDTNMNQKQDTEEESASECENEDAEDENNEEAEIIEKYIIRENFYHENNTTAGNGRYNANLINDILNSNNDTHDYAKMGKVVLAFRLLLGSPPPTTWTVFKEVFVDHDGEVNNNMWDAIFDDDDEGESNQLPTSSNHHGITTLETIFSQDEEDQSTKSSVTSSTNTNSNANKAAAGNNPHKNSIASDDELGEYVRKWSMTSVNERYFSGTANVYNAPSYVMDPHTTCSTNFSPACSSSRDEGHNDYFIKTGGSWRSASMTSSLDHNGMDLDLHLQLSAEVKTRKIVGLPNRKHWLSSNATATSEEDDEDEEEANQNNLNLKTNSTEEVPADLRYFKRLSFHGSTDLLDFTGFGSKKTNNNNNNNEIDRRASGQTDASSSSQRPSLITRFMTSFFGGGENNSNPGSRRASISNSFTNTNGNTNNSTLTMTANNTQYTINNTNNNGPMFFRSYSERPKDVQPVNNNNNHSLHISNISNFMKINRSQDIEINYHGSEKNDRYMKSNNNHDSPTYTKSRKSIF